MKCIFFACLTLLTLSSTLSSQENEEMQEYKVYDDDNFDDQEPYEKDSLSQYVTLGPEFYHVKRLKKGGTKQRGTLYGVYASYDRIKRCRLYWGLEASYATGRLKGTSGRGSPLVSNLTDIEFEGRLGYTLQRKYAPILTFVPFIGGGYFRQTNKFRAPSPLTIHYRDSFSYTMAGFFFDASVMPCLHVGTLFKAKFMNEGKSRITHDIDFGNSMMQMSNRIQYSVELPLTYQVLVCEQTFNASLVPFYEYRHYGSHENFPFDFMDTKYFNIGAKLLASYCF
jgi:hypothetical protein